MNITKYFEYMLAAVIGLDGDIHVNLPLHEVPQEYVITGHVKPNITSLQALVYSNDGLWYPQPVVKLTGNTFTANVVFGNGIYDESHKFYLVVLIGNAGYITTPISSLPESVIMSKLIPICKKAS
jgi:hypothetical protein